MTLEPFRSEAETYRRTSLVNVPSGAALAELRIPADRHGWVVVAHDGAHGASSAIAELNRSGLATVEIAFDASSGAKRLAETVAWLKRSVAEAQGLPVGLLGFGAAASAALSAAAVLGRQLGALVAVNAAPDLAKLRLNGVNTFTLLISGAEHAGVNRRVLQRVRGVARLEIAEGSIENAARVYGAAWLSGHLGAAAPARGMLARLVGSWRVPKLWLGAPSRAAAAFLLAAGTYFASAPDAYALSSSGGGGLLSVTLSGSDSVTISANGGNVQVNGANPDSPGGAVAANTITTIVVNGGTGNNLIDLSAVNTGSFPAISVISADGSDGNDTLLGGIFGEILAGGLGDDSLVGGLGLDTIFGDDSSNSLAGGNDTILGDVAGDSVNGAADSIVAGQGTDLVDGQAGNDIIRGDHDSLTGGNDTLIGGAGDDSIEGMPGDDSITGGDGNDTLNAGGFSENRDEFGANTVDGGNGNDSILGGDGNDTLFGSAGNDTITGDDPAAQVTGTGHDCIDGGTGADLLLGHDGNDTLFVGAGENDNVDGQNGNDLVLVAGGTGITSVAGGADNDTLRFDGTAGNDNIVVTSFGSGFERLEINGLGGDDTLSASGLFSNGFAAMQFDGGSGNDSVVGIGSSTPLSLFPITLLGGDGNDTLSANPTSLTAFPLTLVGGDGDDSLVGSSASDQLQDGGDGSTTAFAGGGADTLTVTGDSLGNLIHVSAIGVNNVSVNGGDGDDTIQFDLDANSFAINLTVNGQGGNDSIEAGFISGTSLAISLFGGDGNDTISGSSVGDTISGDGGDDSLLGNVGNDSITGDVPFSSVAGSDTIVGGDGNDTLIGDNDSLIGGNDLLDGGNGNDSVEGNLGNDEILGGDGDDTLMGNEAREDGSEITTLDADTIDGGIGNDSIFGGFRSDFLDGGDGNDTVAGGRDNDTLLGGIGNDTLNDLDGGDDSLGGGTGNDSFLLKPGSTDIVGDSGGQDTLNFSAATAGVRMDLDAQGAVQDLDGSNNMQLFGVFEGWTGSAFDDELTLSPIVSDRSVDGGAHSVGDVLNFDAKGFGVDSSVGGLLDVLSGGFGDVNHVNFETVVAADTFDSDDIDGDGIDDDEDLDDDNDGIKDDKDPDRDGDGWDNDVEEDLGTDPDDPTDFPADSLVGSDSGTDTDGDGIPDEIEDEVGDLDLGVAAGPLSVSKFKGKLKFPPDLKDTLSFKARLALPLGFTLDGAHIVVDIGGVIQEFDLDAKGASPRADRNNKAKLKLLSAKKQIQDGALLADLTVTLKKQDFSADLADEGMVGTPPPIEITTPVLLFVIVDSSPFQAVKNALYKNKTGATGSFKNTKVLKPVVP